MTLALLGIVFHYANIVNKEQLLPIRLPEIVSGEKRQRTLTNERWTMSFSGNVSKGLRGVSHCSGSFFSSLTAAIFKLSGVAFRLTPPVGGFLVT